MAARLKVFVSSDGLNDYVVAASSRPKALAAWGAHQDLFKTGGARETDDPELIKAALAQPGEVLRRSAKGGRVTLPPRHRAEKPKVPSPAARRLERAQARLADLDGAHEAELDRIAAAREALDAKAEKAEGAYREARARAEEEVEEARRKLG